MKFKSYAQNFEDYLLWRALKNVKKGFYVDVGAQHPVVDSVSRGFYDLGWRGIHVEPVAKYAELLRKDRPDECVLELALGANEGELVLNVIPDTGLSTGDEQIAKAHEQHGFESEKTTVPLSTLAVVLAPYENEEIHWLKIDVEGFEKLVLEGWDSTKHRPWVMLVESTEPLSQNQNQAQWEYLITDADYQFVLFDGINRFYVANEHVDLKQAFTSSINVFDDFTISEHASPQKWLGIKEQRDALLAVSEARLQLVIGDLKSEINQSQIKLTISERKQAKTQYQLAQKAKNQIELRSAQHDSEQIIITLREKTLQQEALIIDAAKQILLMRQSVSWRLTKPIRAMTYFLPQSWHLWLRDRLRDLWRLIVIRNGKRENHPIKIFQDSERSKVMKTKIRALGPYISELPVIGRFFRIVIAIIRLPEERIQFRQHMAEHTVRMHNEENALAATNARLVRHEHFLTTQVPRLAQKVAEINRGLPNKSSNT